LSRFSSYVNSTSNTNADAGADNANMPTALLMPVTPAKQTDARLDQDSPFSDYFTDDARSLVHDVPSSETQQLLVRLHGLQAYLMRRSDDTEREALNILGRKMGEIDLELDALHSQTRLLLEDSGVFMEGESGSESEDMVEDDMPEALNNVLGLAGAVDLLEPRLTPTEKKAEHDFLLLEAQRVLAMVSTAQAQLRQRHAELRELNDEHVLQIEEREHSLEQLRLENEALKCDLGIDHRELLFLKLQFKALEVEVDSPDERSKSIKQKRIKDEMERWRSDWQDVSARFQGRRSRHHVLSVDHQDHDLEEELEAKASDGNEWQLETVKKGHGKLESITIRRLPEPDSAPLGLDGAADNDDTHEPQRPRPPPPAPIRDAGCQTKAIDLPGNRYVEQGIQTDDSLFSDPSVPPLTPSHLEPFPLYRDAFDYHADNTDECAITTSPTTRENSPVIPPLEEKAGKTAWQDLWEGLANLAGGSFVED